MTDKRVCGPYRRGRKVRLHLIDHDGHRTYETYDLYGPWPRKRGPSKSRSKRGSSPSRSRGTPGWIYFVQCCGEMGPIKVGCASDVAKRMYSLQNGNPYELVLLAAVWIADNCEEYEAQILLRFKDQRIRGEWLSWSPELDEAIGDAAKLESARVSSTLGSYTLTETETAAERAA